MIESIVQRLKKIFQGDAAPVPSAHHDHLYNGGSELLYPYLGMGSGPPQPVTSQADRDCLENGITMLAEVVADNPANWPALWLLAQAHDLLGDPLMAYTQYRKALDVNPGNADLMAGMAWQSLCLNRRDEADQQIRSALGVRTGDARFLTLLAASQLLGGKTESATATLAEAQLGKTRDRRTLALRSAIAAVLAGDRRTPLAATDLLDDD